MSLNSPPLSPREVDDEADFKVNAPDSTQPVQEALRRARYGEIVTLDFRGDDGTSRSPSVSLVGTLDPEGEGSLSFVQVRGMDDPEKEALRRHLRAKCWTLPMLRDSRRNDLYGRAIDRACRRAVDTKDGGKRQRKKHLHILDLGTGTGLLAMMAMGSSVDAFREFDDEHQGGDGDNVGEDRGKRDENNCAVSVTAVEMTRPMASLATQTIRSNMEQFRRRGGRAVNTKVDVLAKHSTDISPSEIGEEGRGFGADVLTSELLDHALIGEGIIATVRDAYDRGLIKEGGEVVPRGARIYAALLGCEQTSDRNMPWWKGYLGPRHTDATGGVRLDVKGADNNNGEPYPLCPLAGSYIPVHARECLLRSPCPHCDADDGIKGENVETVFLSDPVQVFAFDFAGGSSRLPPKCGRKEVIQVFPTSAGTVHGALVWWELDVSKNLTYSTAAGRPMKSPCGRCSHEDNAPTIANTNSSFFDRFEANSAFAPVGPWQDHWRQCLYVFNDDGTIISQGDLEDGAAIKLYASHDDLLLKMERVEKFIVHRNAQHGKSCSNKRIRPDRSSDLREEKVQLHRLHRPSPRRALQLASGHRRAMLSKAISSTLEHYKREDRCCSVLDISDFSLGSLFAAAALASDHDDKRSNNILRTTIHSIEASHDRDGDGGIPLLSATIAQVGNANIVRPDRFNILQGRHGSVSPADLRTTDGTVPTIVVAEPHFQAMDDGRWCLPEALHMYYLLRGLVRRGLVVGNETRRCVPAFAEVVACAIECEDLWGAYARGLDGDDDIYGYCHQEALDAAGQFHERDLPVEIWQYRYREMSERCVIGRIDYSYGEEEGAGGEEGIVGMGIRYIQRDDSNGWIKAPIKASGTCHAVLVWVDYGLQTFNEEKNCNEKDFSRENYSILSTNNKEYGQIVRLLKSPIPVASGAGGGDTGADPTATSYHMYCQAELGQREDSEDYSFQFEVR